MVEKIPVPRFEVTPGGIVVTVIAEAGKSDEVDRSLTLIGDDILIERELQGKTGPFQITLDTDGNITVTDL